MIGYFRKLIKVKTKKEKQLEELQMKAKPLFDFINFLKVCGVKFYQVLDIDDQEMKYEIDPSMEQINQWIVKYFEAMEFIRKNNNEKNKK